MGVIQFIFVLIILAIFIAIIYYVLKNGLKALPALVINTVLGLFSMFLLNIVGIHVPINLLTILIAAVFGLLGVAVMAILAIFGML